MRSHTHKYKALVHLIVHIFTRSLILFNFTQNYFKLFFKWLWKSNAQFHMLCHFHLSLSKWQTISLDTLHTAHCKECMNIAQCTHIHMIWMWVEEPFCAHHFPLTSMYSAEFHASTSAHWWWRMQFTELRTFSPNTYLFWYLNRCLNEYICSLFVSRNFLKQKKHIKDALLIVTESNHVQVTQECLLRRFANLL